MSTRDKRFVAHADSLMILRMAFALTLPPRRARRNKQGHWIGYEGRSRVHNFGADEAAAVRWAERQR